MSCTFRRAVVFALVVMSWLPLAADAQYRSPLTEARRQMVEVVVKGAGVKDPRVLQAMLNTPRHEFVALQYRNQAYFDMALPIGEGQTISSPFIVAFMTESLDPQPTDKVLEIGTGSGYQAAVLSPLVKHVYSIEIVESLGRRAARTLQRLNYRNVTTKVGDGFLGWQEHAPFDKIIVTCAPEKIPLPLIEQLKEGGLMVIPVGDRYQQVLYLMRKRDGKMETESLRPTLFVPMTGEAERHPINPNADLTTPRIENGDFEIPPNDRGFVTGWYYQRQLTWETQDDAPSGKHYVTMRNKDAGRPAHVMQGFPLDGRKCTSLTVSAYVRCKGVHQGWSREEAAHVVITFYDEDRRDVGLVTLGPFLGDQPWREVSKTMRVPAATREGILRLGLFGGTGEVSFDNVRITTP